MSQQIFCDSIDLNSISSLVFDSQGNLYGCNFNGTLPNSNVVKIDSAGILTILVSVFTPSPPFDYVNISYLVYVDGWLYATSWRKDIYKINPDTGDYTIFSTLPYDGTYGITYYNDYLYVITTPKGYFPGNVYKIDITNGSNFSVFINSSYFIQAGAITTDLSGNFYITDIGNNVLDSKVLKFDSNGVSLNSVFITGYQYSNIIFYENYLYFTNSNANQILKYDINGILITDNYANGGMSYTGGGIAFDSQGNFYVSDQVNVVPPFPGGCVILKMDNVVCFKENTKILTDKGYIPIEFLKKGDLVKTLKNGFIPINMIGFKNMYNPSSDDRTLNRLYVCSNEKYPDVFEDLIITGCHSVLVNNFKEGEKEKVIRVIGNIYVTDGMFRLPACVDDRTRPYKEECNVIIYHIALDNENYYHNYGIYANGLLVESCSKRYLKEFSKMTLKYL